MRGSSWKGPANSMYKTCIVIDFEDTLMPQDRHIVTKKQSKWTWTFYLFNVHPTLPLTLMVGRNSMLNISKSLDASTNLLGWEYNNKVFQHQIKKKSKMKAFTMWSHGGDKVINGETTMVWKWWWQGCCGETMLARRWWQWGHDAIIMAD